MKTILITGGCGFLGSNIASYYLKNGWKVVVVDMLFRDGGLENKAWLEGQAEDEQFFFFQYDLSDYSKVVSVFECFAPFDYICHLGGQVAMTTSLSDPRRDFNTNALGTFNVLEATRKYSMSSLVAYSSTNKVYGDLEWISYVEGEHRYVPEGYENGFSESLPLDFASPYGCSKGCADQYMGDWYRNYGVKTVVFRHSSIFGGRQFSTFDQGWVGWFCKQALDQKSRLSSGQSVNAFTIAGTGKQVRDVLHANDLINLYVLAYERREMVEGEVFNIGGGISNSLSLIELFRFLEQELEVKLQYQRLERRKSDQDFFVANIDKVKRVLGWNPDVSKYEGVRSMLGWIEQI